MLRTAHAASLMTLTLFLSGCDSQKRSSTGVRTGEFREVADFTFTNQEDRDFSRDELKGKVWVANFVFTTCAAECLVLSARLATLQRQFEGNEEVAFVSFSVDPQTDTPERLAQYAERWHAKPDTWRFLTGDPDKIDHLVKNTFLLPVSRDPIEMGKIISAKLIHSNKFAIVDRKGVVRAYVDGLPEDSTQTVSRIIVQLLQEPSPTHELSSSTTQSIQP
ncbi:MAG: SCO family protein [Verrucomicrobiales bacterium]|nr:SCO family protein [Verrucomicrobiales bacterium]